MLSSIKFEQVTASWHHDVETEDGEDTSRTRFLSFESTKSTYKRTFTL